MFAYILVIFSRTNVTRLSKLLGAKIKENNPNIADLSDQKRPTKLAEEFSELYDNQWTDAYTSLTESLNSMDAVGTLFNILKVSSLYSQNNLIAQKLILRDKIQVWFKYQNVCLVSYIFMR